MFLHLLESNIFLRIDGTNTNIIKSKSPCTIASLTEASRLRSLELHELYDMCSNDSDCVSILRLAATQLSNYNDVKSNVNEISYIGLVKAAIDNVIT